MPTPTFLGVDTLEFTSSTPGDLDVTVPEGTQGVVVMCRSFLGVLTLESSFSGVFQEVAPADDFSLRMFYAPVTSVGEQTITPVYEFSIFDGPVFLVAYVGGIDNSSLAAWVRDAACAITDVPTNPVSLSIDTDSEDLLLVLDSWATSTSAIPANPSGWTSRETQAYNNNAGRLRTADSPGDPSTTVDAELGAGGEYSGLCAIALIGASGGGTVDLAAAATATATSAAQLALVRSLEAAGSAVASASASVLKGVTLTGAGLAVASSGAGMSHSVPLQASAAAVAISGAQMALAISLAATGLATAASAAGLDLSRPLAATATGEAASTATLNVSTGTELAAAGAAAATTSALLSLEIQLSAAAVASAAASAILAGGVVLSAAGSALATGTATLQLSVPITAAALAEAVSSGSLQLTVPLSAAAVAQASSSASFAGSVQMSAHGAALASAAGLLQVLTSAPMGRGYPVAAHPSTRPTRLSLGGRQRTSNTRRP